MDWTTSDRRPQVRSGPPLPDRVALLWQLRAPGGKILSCGLYKSRPRFLEVRCGYGGNELIRSQTVTSHDAGEAVAAAWKLEALNKRFVDLPVR